MSEVESAQESPRSPVSARRSSPHKLQIAFIEEQATQCGYCINGWMMTAAALLRESRTPPKPTSASGLAGLKCRCGSHLSIMRAVTARGAGIGRRP